MLKINGLTFGDLYEYCIESHRVVVMGIYRLLSVLTKDENVDDQKRIVLFYPPSNYELCSSDLVGFGFSFLFKNLYFCLDLCDSTFTSEKMLIERLRKEKELV